MKDQLETMGLCVKVIGKPDYEMHFNLQTLDLEHWKVKLSEEMEILDEVMKIMELEK